MAITCSTCGNDIHEADRKSYTEYWGTSAEGAPVKRLRCMTCDVQEQERLETEVENLSKGDRDKRQIQKLLILTTDFVPERVIKEALGTARGGTVRAKHIGTDLGAGLKGIVGGEIKAYTELLAEGREEAIYRMKSDAYQMGANAVLNVRFMSSMVDVGMVELVAYGTAVIMHEEGLKND